MATKTKTQAAIQPTVSAFTNGNGHTTETKRFTVNVQSNGTVSVTVRTDSEEEALALLDKFKVLVNPTRPRKTRLHPDDPCGADGCNGYVTKQTGTNRKTGATFDFGGCSNYPDCTWTCYLAEEEQTEGS